MSVSCFKGAANCFVTAAGLLTGALYVDRMRCTLFAVLVENAALNAAADDVSVIHFLSSFQGYYCPE